MNWKSNLNQNVGLQEVGLQKEIKWHPVDGEEVGEGCLRQTVIPYQDHLSDDNPSSKKQTNWDVV